MKNKRIVSGLLALVMVITTLLGSVMPAFALEAEGIDNENITVNAPSDLPTDPPESEVPSEPTTYTVTVRYCTDEDDTNYVVVDTYQTAAGSKISVPQFTIPEGYGILDNIWSYYFENETGAGGYGASWNFEEDVIEGNTELTALLVPYVTVTFDVQGRGTAPAPAKALKYRYLSSLPTLEADGYCLLGWYYEPECVTPVTIEYDRMMIDRTVYAKWGKSTATGSDLPAEPIEPADPPVPSEYKVTFASGKDATMPPMVQTPVTVNPGEKVAEPAPQMMEGTVNGVEGSFVGVWYADYECTTKFDFDSAINSDTTVYFGWKEAVTVELYIPYSSNSYLAFKVEKGTSLYDLMKNIDAPQSAVAAFHFKGWRAQGDNDAILTEEDMKNIIVNDDMGLIAQWKGDMVTVKFDTGVAGMEVSPVTIEAGKTFREAGFTLPNLPRDGYVLRAWWRTPEFDEAAPFTVERNMVMGDTTLYAQWECLKTTSSDVSGGPGEAEPEPTPAPHVHSWSGLKSDATSHFYACDCGAKDEVTTHTFNTAGNCTVCGYHSDAAVIAPQPTATPEPTVEPSATPAPEATPSATPTPAPADTTITEEKANDDVVQAAKDAVVVEENKATVDKAAVEAIVDATQEGETVVIPLAQVTEEAVTEAVVNTEALKEVSDNESDIVIQLSEVTVKLDAEALKAVTDQANGENIELKVVKAEKETLTTDQQAALENKETAIVVTAQIFSDGQYIGDFKGGKATVMLPFTPEEGKAAEDYKVYFIGEDGTLEEVMAEYVDGHMVFTTAHFSDYVIVYETALTDTPVQPQEPVTEEKASMPILPIIIGIVVVAAAALLLKKKKA